MFKKILWFIGGVSLTLGSLALADSPLPAFIDVDQFANWYKAEVQTLQAKGIIQGYDEGNGDYSFRPNNNLTRAEMAVMLDRMERMLEANFSSTMNARNYVTGDQLYGVLNNLSALDDPAFGGMGANILLARFGVNPTPQNIINNFSDEFALMGTYNYNGETYELFYHDAGGGGAFYVHRTDNNEDSWYGPYEDEAEPVDCSSEGAPC